MLVPLAPIPPGTHSVLSSSRVGVESRTRSWSPAGAGMTPARRSRRASVLWRCRAVRASRCSRPVPQAFAGGGEAAEINAADRPRHPRVAIGQAAMQPLAIRPIGGIRSTGILGASIAVGVVPGAGWAAIGAFGVAGGLASRWCKHANHIMRVRLASRWCKHADHIMRVRLASLGGGGLDPLDPLDPLD
jgi:hypothetical protein